MWQERTKYFDSFMDTVIQSMTNINWILYKTFISCDFILVFALVLNIICAKVQPKLNAGALSFLVRWTITVAPLECWEYNLKKSRSLKERSINNHWAISG